MTELTKGYLWYKFKFYLEHNKVEILDSNYNVIKRIKINIDSELEKILGKNNYEMTELFDKILEENNLR